jgi:hypothetical protein
MFDTFKLNLGSFCHFDIERLGRPIASMRSAAMFPRLCPQSPGRLGGGLRREEISCLLGIDIKFARASLIVGWCTVETTISSQHRPRPRATCSPGFHDAR